MDPRGLRALAERWMADDLDPDTQQELRALLGQADLAATDLADRFSGRLEFGTAGLRGVLGAGPNRMNRAVVARATWGLARELLASVPGAAARRVVVGGDARTMSRQFSEDVAAILGEAGIEVVLFAKPVPTPLVGFAVAHLGAAAGVVITASHNPREYNGYKVYWENAAQIVPPVDARIAEAINRAPAARDIVIPPLAALRARGRLVQAPPELERSYLDAVGHLAVCPGQGDRGFGIVYTPLHGVGDDLARRALREAGFTGVTSVPEQRDPDSAFPTVTFPNPEEPGTLDLALALAKETGAALVLANDPDADRLAAAVLHEGSLQQFTGNQLGVLLAHYILTEEPPPPGGPKRALLASIVSTPLAGRIAADLGVHYEETLTGFKWIANRAVELEREGYDFVFGFEEALGYCVGGVVRDKDGISAAVLVAEMVAVLRSRGKTLVDELDAIGRRWGVFASAQVGVTRTGADGAVEIQAMMDALRRAPPTRIAGDEVVALTDYGARARTDLRRAVGGATPLALPASNVLAFELASGSRIVARPSGTEPKAKFYIDVCEAVAPGEAAPAARARAEASVERLAQAFRALARV